MIYALNKANKLQYKIKRKILKYRALILIFHLSVIFDMYNSEIITLFYHFPLYQKVFSTSVYDQKMFAIKWISFTGNVTTAENINFDVI